MRPAVLGALVLLALAGETAAAAAAFDGVWIFEGETSLFETVVEVDGGAVEQEMALLVDGDLKTMLFGDVIDDVVGLVVEAQAVRKAAAAAARNADSQHCRVRGQVLLGDDALHLGNGLFSDGHSHQFTPFSFVEQCWKYGVASADWDVGPPWPNYTVFPAAGNCHLESKLAA